MFQVHSVDISTMISFAITLLLSGIIAASKKEQEAAFVPTSNDGQISKSGFVFGANPNLSKHDKTL